MERPIRPGGPVEEKSAVGEGDSWPPGEYIVQMEVDYRLLIDETIEGNNFSNSVDFEAVHVILE